MKINYTFNTFGYMVVWLREVKNIWMKIHVYSILNTDLELDSNFKNGEHFSSIRYLEFEFSFKNATKLQH
jgi:hypothetical protein